MFFFIFRAAVLLELSTVLDFTDTARGRKFHSSIQRKIKCLLNLVLYCRLQETWFHTFLNFFTRIGKKKPHTVKKAAWMTLESGSSVEPSSGSRKLLMSCSISSRLKATQSFADFYTFFFIVFPWHLSLPCNALQHSQFLPYVVLWLSL